MTPVLGLLVVVGVEVDVMQDDGVGGSQIDAQSPSACGQQEDEDVRLFVEPVNQTLSAQAREGRVSLSFCLYFPRMAQPSSEVRPSLSCQPLQRLVGLIQPDPCCIFLMYGLTHIYGPTLVEFDLHFGCMA